MIRLNALLKHLDPATRVDHSAWPSLYVANTACFETASFTLCITKSAAGAVSMKYVACD